MSILLLGFSAYDDYPCEYQLTGADAIRIAQLLQHPISPGTSVWANVTFHHEGLTDEVCNENIEEARRRLQAGDHQLDLIPTGD